MTYDIVIRGGLVVDGTGGPSRVTDIGIIDGEIATVGLIPEIGTEEIDATNLVVAPGWVDIHTHYDGQVTWDPEVSPSSWHGVTTVVMGNCGVGFAPVRSDGHDFLIELMEGVEDIPGTALHEGIDWQWESFPEYLDAVATMPRTVDVLAQIPHAALRAYVMGDRAHGDATDDDVAQMAALVEEALNAGAFGFTTSRTILHSSKHGLVPGTNAQNDELLALADAVGRAGHGVFQLISDHQGLGDDQGLHVELAQRTGGTITYTLAQSPIDPTAWTKALDEAELQAANGLDLRPQVACRPTGMLYGLQTSLHPFITHPTIIEMRELPLSEQVALLRQPEVRAQLLSEEATTDNFIYKSLMSRWNQIFPLGNVPDYEPPASQSIEALASAEGRDPYDVVLDYLLEDEGKAFLFAPLAGYLDFDHEALRTMMEHPRSVVGLSDGGAHCGLICDVSFPTYLLSHWVKGRERGPRLSLEQAVHFQTQQTAEAYGLDDRGVLAEGKRADINLIDLEQLELKSPEMIFDLPGGGRRLVQRADGYVMTIQHGEVTYRYGEPTGNRPGQLVRSA